MSRSTILSVTMLVFGIIFGAGAFALGQKAADRRAEPGRYTANVVMLFGGLGGGGIFVTDHQTNTVYVYSPPAKSGDGESEGADLELTSTIDLTSAGQPKLKVILANPLKDQPKKDQSKKDAGK